MKLYMAGGEGSILRDAVLKHTGPGFKVNVLESYWAHKYKSDDYLDRLHKFYCDAKATGKYENIMLDSGAHSIIFAYTGAKKTMHLMKEIKDIDKYMKDYLRFVRRMADVVDFFFEVDSAPFTFSYDEQQRWRDEFFKITNPNRDQFLPVWHVRYGKNQRETMTQHLKDYSYIGIPKEADLPWSDNRFASYFELVAQHKCTLHGLALTGYSKFRNFPFRSADSTSWSFNARTKKLFCFDQETEVAHTVDLGVRRDATKRNLRAMNPKLAEPVHTYAQYLIKKYELDVKHDLFWLGEESSPSGVCAIELGLLNICTYLEMQEKVNRVGHKFDGKKKQGELFDFIHHEGHK